MGLYIPSIEQLPLKTDSQKANAERILSLIGALDSEVLLPNWSNRIDAWNSFLDAYDPSPRDMGTATKAVVGAVCNIEKVEDSRKRHEVLRYAEDSDFGHLLSKVTTNLFALHDVGFFLKSVTEKDGFDRDIFKAGAQTLAKELTMLGTEFKVSETYKLFENAAQREHLPANLLFYVGQQDNPTFTQLHVENAFDELIVLADAYTALKRQKVRPVEPERLIGIVHNVLRNCDIIK